MGLRDTFQRHSPEDTGAAHEESCSKRFHMRKSFDMALLVFESRCPDKIKTFYGHGLACLFAVLLGLLCTGAAHADNIFVGNQSNGTIGEYTTSGAVVNASLVSGLSGRDIAPDSNPVPIPGTILLFAPGLVGLAKARRRFKK